MTTTNTSEASTMGIERKAFTPIELAPSKKVSFDESNLRKNLQSRTTDAGLRKSSEISSSCENDKGTSVKRHESSPVQISLPGVDSPETEPEPKPEEEEVGSVVKPEDNDILSGRGAGVNLHPGNVFFRKLIQSNKAVYVKSDPGAKKRIIREIVEVATQHGRFLKQDPETELWVAISGDEVKRKTGQALRENAPAIKKLNKQKAEVIKRNMKIAQLASMANFIPSKLESINITSTTVPLPTMSVPLGDQPQLHQVSNNLNQSRDTMNFDLSSHSQFLWSRMNMLSEKQEQLKRKQRELEDEQNRLMQYFYEMTAASTLSPALSSFTKSSQALSNAPNGGNRQESKFNDAICSRVGKKRRIMVPGHC